MAADKKKRKKGSLSPGEKRRLRQLMVCLILFAIVFLGRGVNLGPVSQFSSRVGALVRADTDFQAVFSQVGESFSRGEPAVETFRSLWSGLMSPEAPASAPAQEAQPDSGGSAPQPAQEEVTNAQIA